MTLRDDITKATLGHVLPDPGDFETAYAEAEEDFGSSLSLEP
jgi:hypothetical protein